MEAVTIYLRTALFAFDKGGEDPHVPRGATVIDGQIADRPAGFLAVQVTAFRDGSGRLLAEAKGRTLHLPVSKVDHLEVHES